MAIVIGLMNRKGGAGKSTLTKLLASAVAHSKKKCLVIDLDPAEDILKWWTRAESKGHYDEKIMVRSTVVAEDSTFAPHDLTWASRSAEGSPKWKLTTAGLNWATTSATSDEKGARPGPLGIDCASMPNSSK